ncbi:sulfotransferase family protein [Kitasatospora sp. NPDC006697]|uniref:sulfotransferase family protein n=1 Tax=Kitasatospora sp. NPDC006697 TaxID=3364020 RepID=UPI0036B477EE
MSEMSEMSEMSDVKKRQPFSSAPVLLGGENRSGTTLQSILLDSHPDLVVGPEIDFVEPVDLGPHILQACDLLDAGDPRVLGPGTDTADPYWYDGAHFVKQCERCGLSTDDVRGVVTAAMAESAPDVSSFGYRCLVVDRIGELMRSRAGVSRWGLKLQRKIRRVDDYAAVWPNAHFIHIVRDGRDLAASHLKTVPAWGYKSVARAAEGWVEVVARPHTVAPPGRYLEVRYEDLVSAPRTAIGGMLDHLGLPWDDAVLRHSELEHSLFAKPWGHPAADATGQPLSQDRIARYREDLTPGQIEEFEAIAGSELSRLGYPLSGRQAG